MKEGVDDALELLHPGIVLREREPRRGPPEDRGEGRGGDRQTPLEVVDEERAAVAGHPQLAALEDLAVGSAEDGQEHPPAQPLLGRSPVDVEVIGEARARAVLEHVDPPGVLAGADPHVVGDEVDDMAHPAGAEGVCPGHEGFGTADLGVELGRIDQVVAVRAPRLGLQVR